MKKTIFYLSLLLPVLFLVSCEEDEEVTGQPELTLNNEINQAHFGDSIPFSADVRDAEEVPLSTLKAQLFFGNEMVEETVIRTKTEGEYNGKIYVPFLKDIPDGTATLKFVLQNIEFAIEEQNYNLDISRPDYPKSPASVILEGCQFISLHGFHNKITKLEVSCNPVLSGNGKESKGAVFIAPKKVGVDPPLFNIRDSVYFNCLVLFQFQFHFIVVVIHHCHFFARNSHYYIIGHLAAVVKPGAVRIGTSGYEADGVIYSAFENKDGSFAFVLMNDTDEKKMITISDRDNHFSYDVPAQSVVSYRWNQ